MKLTISYKIWQKLMAFGQLADTDEISGLGRTIVVSPEEAKLVDIYFLSQQGTRSTTELDKREVAQLLAQKRAEGIDTKEINCWWHFHTDFETFWSGTDEDTIKSFVTDGHIISVVLNKKGDAKGRIDTFKPFILSNDIEVGRESCDPEIFEETKKEFADKFKKRSFNFREKKKDKIKLPNWIRFTCPKCFDNKWAKYGNGAPYCKDCDVEMVKDNEEEDEGVEELFGPKK
jgi:hypothetical protein